MHHKIKKSDYLKNILKLNTNTIDPKQHNEVDRMRITWDDKTLIFCVGVFKGRSLSFYLSTTTLLHPQPPPSLPRLNSTQPKHFCHLRCWFFSESKVGNTLLSTVLFSWKISIVNFKIQTKIILKCQHYFTSLKVLCSHNNMYNTLFTKQENLKNDSSDHN